MWFKDYLQGSYRNATNIWRESDVDIVVECKSIFWHNLTPDERDRLRFTTGKHSLDDFRAQIIGALEKYFGKAYVDSSGANSVKVLPEGPGMNKLRADVVICAEYGFYSKPSLTREADGITFWNRENGWQVINYPAIHVANGERKHADTSDTYKKTVRLFKNARVQLCKRDVDLVKKFPSYFVECLIFNVPNPLFSSNSWQDVFLAALSHLRAALKADLTTFTTQSRRHALFGPDSWQWNQPDAIEFIDRLADLWENYYE
jgi:hypothetical protein